MTTYIQIREAEQNLEALKRAYLRRWGWEETSNMPGGLWMWRRDFSDVDAARSAWDKEHRSASPSVSYGVITASTEAAIAMTTSCLDEQHELDDDS
jgi:hypothetical protein